MNGAIVQVIQLLWKRRVKAFWERSIPLRALSMLCMKVIRYIMMISCMVLQAVRSWIMALMPVCSGTLLRIQQTIAAIGAATIKGCFSTIMPIMTAKTITSFSICIYHYLLSENMSIIYVFWKKRNVIVFLQCSVSILSSAR